MSERAARRLIWLLLVLVLPLPLLGIESALVPVARMLMLAGLCLGVIVLESANGVVGILLGLFGVQALVYGAGLWLASFALGRGLGRLAPRRRAVLVALLTLAALAVASSLPLYETPYRARSLHATWLEVFE